MAIEEEVVELAMEARVLVQRRRFLEGIGRKRIGILALINPIPRFAWNFY